MTVNKYSVARQGKNFKVSDHFKLSEFQCKNKADEVLIDSQLLVFLEKLRDYLGGDGICTIGINSGYRTAAYNRSIGGASSSTHCKGFAADIVVKQYGKRVSGKLICCLAQTLGFKGIGFIKGSGYAVHLDMYNRIYRGDEQKGYSNNVGGDFYKYFGVKKNQIDALKVKTAAQKLTNSEGDDDEDMTQEKFNGMMEVYLSQLSQKAPNKWSEESRNWAENNGIINGTGNSMAYLSFCTREQIVEFLYRFNKGLPDGSEKDAIIDAMVSALQSLK